MLLISLIGEQPIPNLLPIRHLQPAENLLVYTSKTEAVARRLRRIVSGRPDMDADLRAEPYDFDGLRLRLENKLKDRVEVLVNLTGGTKMMAMAAFSLAAERGLPFVYMENQKSTLLRYHFEGGKPVLKESLGLPELISTEDYLHAHLDSFTVEGFSKDDRGSLTDGGLFERAVFGALKAHFGESNILAGVRPSGVAGQIDIDLVIRVGNQVGIAEVKLGGGEGPKKGLDQLKMAGESDYLGTYTAQFLITASRGLNSSLQTLATNRKIKVIALPEYRENQPLSKAAADRLVKEIRQKLAG